MSNNNKNEIRQQLKINNKSKIIKNMIKIF